MPKNITYKDTIEETDTAYGISEDIIIPIRQTNIKTNIIKDSIQRLFEPEHLVAEVASWQICILLGSILLIGFVKAFSNSRFNQGIKALFNYTVAQEITREEKVFFHRSNIFFSVIHLLTTSLFFFQFREGINSGDINNDKFPFFLLILMFLAGMYFVKYIFSRVLLFVFNDLSFAPEYIFNISLYNNLLGTILVPILCATYFTELLFQDILIFLAIPFVLIVFVLRLFRLIKIGQTRGVSYVYIFVYICSLEILPLVVLFRIFILQ